MPKPDRHFTELPSGLDVHDHDEFVRVDGAGFLTLPMTQNAFAAFVDGQHRNRVLVDLRNVSGYEAECVSVAQEWLASADERRVQRIAFIANSSVVRTAVEVVARHLRVPLRAFDSATRAEAWARQALDDTTARA